MTKHSPRLREMRRRIKAIAAERAHEDVTELELEELADAIIADLAVFLAPDDGTEWMMGP